MSSEYNILEDTSYNKIYINEIIGTDNASAGTQESPFKTLAKAYDTVKQHDAKSLFISIGDKPQVIPAGEYSRGCGFSGNYKLLIDSSAITFQDVTFGCNIEIELDPLAEGQPSVIFKGNCTFTSGSSITVKEKVPKSRCSYPYKILCLNEGVLQSSACAKITMGRMFTFIKNVNEMSVKFPVETKYQGGDLFIGSAESKSNKISGDEDVSCLVKVSHGYTAGYLYSSKVNNGFTLGSFDNGCDIQDCHITIESSGISDEQQLFSVGESSSGTVKKCSLVNTGVGKFVLCKSPKVLSIRNSLTGITYNKPTEVVITIKCDYTLDDYSGDVYHIESDKDIIITIPDELDIKRRELFFRRSPNNGHLSKVTIKSNKFKDTISGAIILTRRNPQVTLYNHQNEYYTKTY